MLNLNIIPIFYELEYFTLRCPPQVGHNTKKLPKRTTFYLYCGTIKHAHPRFVTENTSFRSCCIESVLYFIILVNIVYHCLSGGGVSLGILILLWYYGQLGGAR